MAAFMVFKICLVAGALGLAFFELYRTRRDLARTRVQRSAHEAATVEALPSRDASDEPVREVANG